MITSTYRVTDVVTGKLDVRQAAANPPGRTEQLESAESVEDEAEASEAASQVNTSQEEH